MTRNSESQNLRILSENKKVFVSRFRDLAVYQKAFEASLDIHKESMIFPKTEQYGGLADQMRRASKSICANIAEGYAKQQRSKAEFKRFLLIAIGSAHEMQVWIDYCINLGYVDSDTSHSWSCKYDEIVRMLQSLYSKT
ncbi:MAG: four helix bundle protein [Alphaproteobacteria bacterium]|nr:four helix bundle protein [Alphaproteobacteria bacterium]